MTPRIQMASKTWHTVEFSKNRHTPRKPGTLSPEPPPGQPLKPNHSRPACQLRAVPRAPPASSSFLASRDDQQPMTVSPVRCPRILPRGIGLEHLSVALVRASRPVQQEVHYVPPQASSTSLFETVPGLARQGSDLRFCRRAAPSALLSRRRKLLRPDPQRFTRASPCVHGCASLTADLEAFFGPGQNWSLSTGRTRTPIDTGQICERRGTDRCPALLPPPATRGSWR